MVATVKERVVRALGAARFGRGLENLHQIAMTLDDVACIRMPQHVGQGPEAVHGVIAFDQPPALGREFLRYEAKRRARARTIAGLPTGPVSAARGAVVDQGRVNSRL